MLRHSVRLEIGGKEEKTATGLASFTKSAKTMFFQAIIHFTFFISIISESGACLAQNNLVVKSVFGRPI